MTKETRLTFRVQSELKKSLEAIAAKEARSVAQVCEVILQSGVAAYQKEGAKYLQRLIGSKRPKGD
jgi:predicted transcriptional regulator